MRVAIDGRTIQDHFPGIGRYVYNLTAALAGLDQRPEIVLIHDPSRPSTRFDLDALGVTLAPLPLTPFHWRSQVAAPRLLRRLRVDLYHATYFIMPYWAGRPTVVTMYDAIPFIYPQYLPSAWARLSYRLSAKLASRRAARILAISQSDADDLARYLGIPQRRISVTPLAADRRFAPMVDRDAVARWRHEAGLPERYVLYLGINKPHKNLERLVRAWHIVRRRWPAGHGDPPALVLAGREDRRFPEARQTVQDAGLEGAVRFLGDVSDDWLPWLYNGAELFVFPSLYEGFGLPVLEAMACGLPVACSNRSSLPEIVGAAAVTFDPMSVEEMAAGLHGLLVDADERSRRAALSLQEATRFSWQRTAIQTMEAYRQVVHS